MNPVRILHLHSSFDLGGKEARAVRLMNHFGKRAEHVILSAVPEALSARKAIDPSVKVSFPANAPPLHGKPSLARYAKLTSYFLGFDLILSYNWGAMDGVMARTLFMRAQKLPPLVHHEDGFNEDEFQTLNWKRNWFRKIALGGSQAIAVPSATLEAIARDIWKQPVGKIHRIPNGIAVKAYGKKPQRGAIPGFIKRDGEIVVGTIAGLRPIKNLPRLVRACAAASDRIRLVIVGEGPERERIIAEAERQGMGARLLLPGFLAKPERYVGLFDIFSLSSDSEQFPIALLEAMAAGLPVVSTDVGDVAAMLSAANQDYVAASRDDMALADMLGQLVIDDTLRQRLGAANRERALAEYDEGAMLARYTALYARAMRRPDFAG
jgi:glycosyltransferase involved in cell wall biosynthesis